MEKIIQIIVGTVLIETPETDIILMVVQETHQTLETKTYQLIETKLLK